MKILALSPTPTAPLNFGNRIRIHRVLSHLKGLGHEVHLLHYASESDWRASAPLDQLTQMARTWDTVTTIPATRELHPPPAGEDHTIDEWWDPAIEAFLVWLFRRASFDVFIVNYTWLSKALELAPSSVLKVLDTHDKFADRRHLLQSLNLSPEFFHTTESEEAIALKRADLVLAIKEEEAEYFHNNGAQRVDTLIHADPPRFSNRATPRELKVFGIFAARNNINVANITRFIETAAGVFRKYLCPLEVHIYGSVCRDLEHLTREQRYSFVRLKGYVETQQQFYEQVDCVLIPMDVSTGLKIKAAEALSFGKPIIAHRHGFEGLPAFHSFQQLESFEDIAEACITCAFDDKLLAGMATATKRSEHSAERHFEGAIRRMLQTRAEVLPKNVVVWDTDDGNGLDAEDIACAADLARYLSYRFELGVVVAGGLSAEQVEPLTVGHGYTLRVSSIGALQAPEYADWIAGADRVVTNSVALLQQCRDPQWKSVFYDARLGASARLPRTLLRQDISLVVMQSDGAVGTVGLPPQRPADTGRVVTVSLPRRFWKAHELGPGSGLKYDRLRGYLPDALLQPESAHPELHRSASGDAGWAKVWRLLAT